MKSIINRVFSRPEPQPRHSGLSSELIGSDIENYYLKIIGDCLKRMLVTADSVEVDVRRSGTGPTGLASYAAYVRLLRWDPVLTPVLLQNLPVIDARIRRMVAASVILEQTHFSGVWFQATSTTPGAPSALVGMPAELVRQPGGSCR
ncbi:MAG TPA: hypothetical protein VHA82_12150 [Ramlibacter sp.]|uniref:hypothetical protein n=1 Tax=Ramlibacter sp. TaxID=1917967 RepID=UPI002CBC2FB3|nr:hypothetical protein [Ramlibacter sp.]HVZ44554.1 hypothetical protein [Ramlibacter sp.]